MTSTGDSRLSETDHTALALDACPGPRRHWVPALAFAAVLLLFVGQFVVWIHTGREPFPAIEMPSFAGVPEADGNVVAKEARLSVTYSGGTSETLTKEQLLPYNEISPLNAVVTILGDPAVARRPQTTSWLRQRIAARRPGSDPVSLHVRWVLVHFDRRTKAKSDVRTIEAYTVDLGRSR